ncbi:L-serine ammonia-lyase [Aestuariivirga sp.]|uniref:L-serine ammonia-lyase n=1 Tax=Aestuariivirga sp. TaxID=2650926 RepID=UPI00359418F6
MFLSVFDIFKIGIGPSSSHTVGPMVAAARFLEKAAATSLPHTGRLTVTLHGSLAFTGKGHGTDRAVILGLAGEKPDAMDPDRVEDVLRAMSSRGAITLPDGHPVSFNPARDVIFDFGPALKGHSNGMVFRILDDDNNTLLAETYFSIGGGFVQTEAERMAAVSADKTERPAPDVPYPFRTAAEMLDMGRISGLTIADMKRANETVSQSAEQLDANLDRIWGAMRDCMNRGLAISGTLPGGLKIKRRAAEIHQKLKDEQGNNAIQPHRLMDWLSVYAMAVNEENAAGSRVVTAPTNGAAGVIPATIRYYLDHCLGADINGIRIFLLAAAAIGGLIKHNASISGAEVGCQGEVGSASAMAAAGLCAALGGSNEQVENAAEIALEHHLGMTCDPVGGLVQVPCIERNAFGAVKAVTAASLALRGDGTHFVPLDTCVETMRQTGLDMNERYKETSTGGLAVNVVEC